MERIVFEDNITKANANTFNTLQDNIENAINDITPIIDIADDNGCVRIGNIGIEWGVVDVTPTSGTSPNYYGNATVTFQNTYANTPIMIACSGVGYTSVTNVGAFSVTKTKGEVFMLATAQTERNCRYIVIGKIQ